MRASWIISVRIMIESEQAALAERPLFWIIEWSGSSAGGDLGWWPFVVLESGA